MKTLVLLITLILVFVLGYMVGTWHAQPSGRSPIQHPETPASTTE